MVRERESGREREIERARMGGANEQEKIVIQVDVRTQHALGE